MGAHPLDAVIAGHMCSGCGACAYLGADNGVRMQDVPSVGSRPVGVKALPLEVKDRIIAACPGTRVQSPAADLPAPPNNDELLVGHSERIWEGWAADPAVRRRASSGGIVTALAAYCVERLGMRLVVHTGMEPARPWTNRTVTSSDAEGLLANAGSRYAPSSPVEALRLIEEADGPCVFIGKPCDVAAVAELRKQRPALDRNLGAVLSFFCAGTPASAGSLALAESLGFESTGIASLHYRGDGWPGRFRVRGRDGQEASLSYDESWGALARRHRQLRCQICPDGLGELADVTGGDAWHRRDESPDGISVVLARTALGRTLVEDAAAAGYLELAPSDAGRVVAAQGLVRRRKLVAARLTALRVLGLPVPRFRGFHLWRAALPLGPVRFAREVGGTLRRGLTRGYRRPESYEEER